jgi:hypothetical protein
MKILRPWIILTLLIITLIIVNCLFLFETLHKNKTNSEDAKKRNYDTFLKNNINLNKTTFEVNSNVYIYYGSNNKKFDLNFKENKTNILNTHINNNNKEYYYDTENDIFIDYKSIICKVENFNFKLKECENQTFIYIIQNNTNDICYNKEYECVYDCYNNLGMNINLTECDKLCKKTIWTQIYNKQYCHISESILNKLNFTIDYILSKE